MYWKRQRSFLFNKQGKFIKMIGRQGKGPGEYIDPDDISIDRENKKYMYWTPKLRMY